MEFGLLSNAQHINYRSGKKNTVILIFLEKWSYDSREKLGIKFGTWIENRKYFINNKKEWNTNWSWWLTFALCGTQIVNEMCSPMGAQMVDEKKTVEWRQFLVSNLSTREEFNSISGVTNKSDVSQSLRQYLVWADHP